MIENESRISLAVKSPNLPVPDHLASFVQSPVRVLGAYTAVSRRRLCPDEDNALPRLLGPSPCWLPSNFLSGLCLPCLMASNMAGSPDFRPLLLRRVMVGCPSMRWKMLRGKQACSCPVLRRKLSPGSSLRQTSPGCCCQVYRPISCSLEWPGR